LTYSGFIIEPASPFNEVYLRNFNTQQICITLMMTKYLVEYSVPSRDIAIVFAIAVAVAIAVAAAIAFAVAFPLYAFICICLATKQKVTKQK
jgi:uncharacterized membrane protein